MFVVLKVWIFVFAVSIVCSRRGIFDQDADSILKDMIGDIDKERLKWTTPQYQELEKQLRALTEATKKHVSTTLRRGMNKTMKNPWGNITLEDIKRRKRLREVMKLIDERNNPIPDFERGDDDTAMITRRFDGQQKEFLRKRERIRKSNVWRNRTIMIMDHFVHATRYKLPYSQLLRKKYFKVTRYKIGYLFGLLTHLKRQQLYLYTSLQFFREGIYYLHMHMRMYEKIVRLDVDIKDVIRTIRLTESKRRLGYDPKYYDEYYDAESTSPTRPRHGVEEIKMTSVTIAPATVQDRPMPPRNDKTTEAADSDDK